MKRLCLLLVALMLSFPAHAEETQQNVPRYVGFPMIIVNTSDGVDINGLFSIKLQLQVTGEAHYKTLLAMRPVLQDALTQATFRLGQLYVDPRRPVPWDKMIEELNTAVKRVSPNFPIRVLILETTTLVRR